MSYFQILLQNSSLIVVWYCILYACCTLDNKHILNWIELNWIEHFWNRFAKNRPTEKGQMFNPQSQTSHRQPVTKPETTSPIRYSQRRSDGRNILVYTYTYIHLCFWRRIYAVVTWCIFIDRIVYNTAMRTHQFYTCWLNVFPSAHTNTLSMAEVSEPFPS